MFLGRFHDLSHPAQRIETNTPQEKPMEKLKQIELIKPPRHAGRDYPPGAKD